MISAVGPPVILSTVITLGNHGHDQPVRTEVQGSIPVPSGEFLNAFELKRIYDCP